jgi:hypothetical protein
MVEPLIRRGNRPRRCPLLLAADDWVAANPQEWRAALAKHNLRWGHDIHLKGGPDDPHIEWTGPQARPAAPKRSGQNIPLAQPQHAQNLGKASIDVNVKAPRGTGVKATADGVFEDVRLRKTPQMAPSDFSDAEVA